MATNPRTKVALLVVSGKDQVGVLEWNFPASSLGSIFPGRFLNIGDVVASSGVHPSKIRVAYAESVIPFSRATCFHGLPSARFRTIDRLNACSCLGIQEQLSGVYPKLLSLRSIVSKSVYPVDIAHV